MKITLPEDSEKDKEAPGSNINEDMLEVSEMSRKERKKYLRRQEQEKMGSLSKQERLHYFWDYYKWPTIIGVILVFCFITLCKNIYENSIPYDLSLVIVNSTNDSYYYDDFEADYRAFINSDPKHNFRVDSNYVVKYDENGIDLSGVSSSVATAYERLVAYSRSDYYDAIITDEEGYQYAFHSELIYNLKSFISDELLESIKDYIIYDTLEDGTSIPIAIDITNSPKIDLLKISYSDQKVYLAFMCHSESNLRHIEQLIKYFTE